MVRAMSLSLNFSMPGAKYTSLLTLQRRNFKLAWGRLPSYLGNENIFYYISLSWNVDYWNIKLFEQFYIAQVSRVLNIDFGAW